jgi:hypothetical protein
LEKNTDVYKLLYKTVPEQRSYQQLDETLEIEYSILDMVVRIYNSYDQPLVELVRSQKQNRFKLRN